MRLEKAEDSDINSGSVCILFTKNTTERGKGIAKSSNLVTIEWGAMTALLKLLNSLRRGHTGEKNREEKKGVFFLGGGGKDVRLKKKALKAHKI